MGLGRFRSGLGGYQVNNRILHANAAGGGRPADSTKLLLSLVVGFSRHTVGGVRFVHSLSQQVRPSLGAEGWFPMGVVLRRACVVWVVSLP